VEEDSEHCRPVAELRPLPKPPLGAAALLRRWNRLPPVDSEKLRADLDAVLDASRAARQAHVQQAEADFDPLPFDAAAARAFVRVAASLRRSGRKRVARAYDARIAAVAVSRGLSLYTCNPDDFDGIEGLDVVAVPFE